MTRELEIAAQMVGALCFLEVQEVKRGERGIQALRLFLPQVQLLPLVGENEISQLAEPGELVLIRDRLGVRHCVVGLEESVLILGPYRTGNLRRYEAEERLKEVGGRDELVEDYLKYLQSLPVLGEENVKTIVHTLLAVVYGRSRVVRERHIDMELTHGHVTLPQVEKETATAESLESRHSLEDLYMSQIRQGDERGAYDSFRRLSAASAPGGSVVNREGFAIVRTLTRVAVRSCGIPSVSIHGVTEVYRTQFEHAHTEQERYETVRRFIGDVCALVHRFRTMGYSPEISQCVEYIGRNLGSMLTLTELAREIGMAPTWLSRKFHQETGATLTEFVTQKRMEVAADYLRYTNLSIQQVGETVGIGDGNYFTKVFKKWAGVTPREYRRRGHTQDGEQ